MIKIVKPSPYKEKTFYRKCSSCETEFTYEYSDIKTSFVLNIYYVCCPYCYALCRHSDSTPIHESDGKVVVCTKQ